MSADRRRPARGMCQNWRVLPSRRAPVGDLPLQAAPGACASCQALQLRLSHVLHGLL